MRALPIGLLALGLMGIVLVGVPSPATSTDKIVIGVLDVERIGTAARIAEIKKALIKELRRNTRVKLVDIRESCNLSDLKKHGYKRADRYKNAYQLDMILHVHTSALSLGWAYQNPWELDFSLIDLYTKKVKAVSMEINGPPDELWLGGICGNVLVNQDLDRVLRTKKKALGK